MGGLQRLRQSFPKANARAKVSGRRGGHAFDGDWGGATQIAVKGLWAARILNTFEQNQNPQVGQVAPGIYYLFLALQISATGKV